jgi:hypothetical protein
MISIPEADWKVLRSIHDVVIARLCQRIINEVMLVAVDGLQTSHERYGDIYGIVQDRNNDVARMFDGMSRSKALDRIMMMRADGLIEDDEYLRFSESTRALIDGWLSR